MIREHDLVVLTADPADERLKAGDVGTVVHVYKGGGAFEVEFAAFDGETLAVVTVAASGVRPVGRQDIPHARPLAAV